MIVPIASDGSFLRRRIIKFPRKPETNTTEATIRYRELESPLLLLVFAELGSILEQDWMDGDKKRVGGVDGGGC